MYDPTVGRFLEEDPIGFRAGDGNLGRYVGNQSTDYVDPTGFAIKFPDQNGADAFVRGIIALGAKSVITAAVPGDSSVYVMTDSRDLDAVFGYVDKAFPLPDFSLLFCEFSDRPKEEQDLIQRRNRFIIAAGIAGWTALVTDMNGRPATGDAQVLQNLQNRLGNRQHVVSVDIGGEGKSVGAINVNIMPKSTPGLGEGALANEHPIPRLLVREGREAKLPFGDGTIKTIIVQSTPISNNTADEIARVICVGGKIILHNPDDPDNKSAHDAVISRLKSRGNATQRMITVDGNATIETIIEVDR